MAESTIARLTEFERLMWEMELRKVTWTVMLLAALIAYVSFFDSSRFDQIIWNLSTPLVRYL
jgi:hypothetical protein